MKFTALIFTWLSDHNCNCSRLGRFMTRKPTIYGPGGDWDRDIGGQKEHQNAKWNMFLPPMSSYLIINKRWFK